jgi:hypothetical protein
MLSTLGQRLQRKGSAAGQLDHQSVVFGVRFIEDRFFRSQLGTFIFFASDHDDLSNSRVGGIVFGCCER